MFGRIPLGRVYLATAAICTALATVAAWGVSSREAGIVLDNLHWTISISVASLLLAVAWRTCHDDRREFRKWAFLGFLAAFIGQIIFDIQAAFDIYTVPDIAAIPFLLRTVLIAAAIRCLIPSRDRGIPLPVLLDTAAFTLLLMAIILAVYLPVRGEVPLATFVTLVAYPAGFFGLSAMTILVLLERHERMSFTAIALAASPFVIGVCWTVWNAHLLTTGVPVATGLGIEFSLVNLAWSAAAARWQPGVRVSLKGDRWFATLHWLLPFALAVAAFVTLEGVVRFEPVEQGMMGFCLAGTVVLALLRQSMLLRHSEQLAKADEEARRFREQVLGGQRMQIIGSVAAGVAHDLNNMLAVIVLNSGMARDAKTVEERRELLDNLDLAAQYALGTVRRVMEFAGEQVSAPRFVAVESLLGDVRRLLATGVPKSHAVQIAGDEGLPLLLCVPSRIFQVLMNLGLNASHAIGDSSTGTIAFTARQIVPKDSAAPPLLEIAVRDNGHGMSADVAARAFDPFFTTKPKGAGTGLGLATVRDIVTEHGGTVELTSAPGTGTTVTLRLPFEPPAPMTPPFPFSSTNTSTPLRS